MEQPQASPPVYKPSLHNHHHQTPTLASSELASTDQCHSVGDMKDSQLVGVKVALARDVDMAEEKEAKMEVAVVGKRKRGRPARGLPRTPPPLKKKRDEEDVCFICFDGGCLVLCDRRGCPKAYHPACIKRDESFFRSKAKWNCGWHICSICQKASHYMCYTCTYSVCKGCTNGADFVCVRGNKGLCGACMRTIMLIENIGQGTKAMCEVDFDDKSSWEYLFKVYWMYLKGKLSLTLDELVRARNPWKGAAPMSYKVEAPRELHHLKDDKGSGSENSCIDIESNNLENKKSKRQSKLLHKEDCFDRITSCGDNSVCVSLPECTKWASEELLEFVAHMKNGDTSLLSQFDVHTLLLEYVKKNNLCDPQQKCQIVCDSRLLNLFGKTRLGHSEMLKLLESHFLIKENGPEETTVRAGIIDAVASQGEGGDNYYNQLMLVNDKKHKTQTWKKADVQVTQNNPDEYAAINAHNINLIYLRRSLMENLTEEAEKIHEKVVGSFVRIRMSSSDQKQEMYRLVQVVGTSKVAEPYKIGARTTDIVLEISNLNRKEVIKIDEISNLEFSEDECKRLRQSIKYGFSKRLTVGEIHDKALTLQPMRVNDLLESEILQLNHLRDRASEKGHRKELRECVEKLQLLSSPEERQRRLREMPEIHSDPNRDSYFDSDEDADESDERKQDDNIRSKCSGFDRKESGSISSSQDGVLNDVGCRTQELPTAQESIGNICVIKNQINPNDVGIDDSTKAGLVRSEASGVSLDISSLFLSTGMEQQFNDFVNDKSWHYQDPTGKVQGPFTLLQLYKWNASGHFPPDLRIWRMDGKQDDAMLLTDALPCSKDVSLPYNSQLRSSGVSVRLDNGDNSQDDGENTTNKIQSDKRIVEQSWEQKMDDPCTQSNGKDESVRSNGWHSHSSSSSIPADGNNKEQSGKSERREESLKCEISCHEQPQGYLSLHSTAFSENLNENPSDKLREGHGFEGNSEEDNGNHGSNGTSEGQSNSAQSSLKQADSEENSGQSSGQNWRRPHVNSSSNCLVMTSALVSVRKTSPQKLGFNLPSPAPVTSSSNCRDSPSAFVSVAKQSPNHLEIDFFELPSHTSKPGNSESLGQSAENKQLASSNVPVQEAGPSWSTTSSLVNGETALPEVTVEWRRYSPAPPNPSVEEWDSNVVSASPLKPAETVGDCAATPSSICGQLTHSSPSHPACNTSTWQAIIGESNDVDESVSDLLAEVEALESLGGLESPTSIMNCGEDLTEGSKTECLSSAEGLSPMLDGGKGDALSSTGEIKLSSQPTTAEEPLCRADVHHHHQRISGEHSSRSSEGTKKNGVSGNQWESGAENPSIVPSSVAWDLTTDTWRLGSESTRGGWEVSQGNANLDWGGMHQGNANMGWGAGQPTVQENRSANSYTSIGGTAAGFGGSETRYGSDRFSAPRDRGFQGHGRESSFFGRGRTVGNRQPLYGFGNGGSHKPPPKGQRICKFYGSGYCKKGASCDYLHL